MAKPDLSHIVEPLRSMAVAVSELRPDPSNARKHNERNLDAIKASLAAFGQRKPIVVQREGMLVRAGNGTLTAAKALGWSHIAAVIIDDDNSTAAQFAIADNRTAELAEWDNETLALLLDGWDKQTREAVGFDQGDVESMLQSFEVALSEAPDMPDGDRAPIRQMTFTVHDDQHVDIERAIRRALADGGGQSESNQNSNGNALHFICRAFLDG